MWTISIILKSHSIKNTSNKFHSFKVFANPRATISINSREEIPSHPAKGALCCVFSSHVLPPILILSPANLLFGIERSLYPVWLANGLQPHQNYSHSMQQWFTWSLKIIELSKKKIHFVCGRVWKFQDLWSNYFDRQAFRRTSLMNFRHLLFQTFLWSFRQ